MVVVEKGGGPTKEGHGGSGPTWDGEGARGRTRDQKDGEDGQLGLQARLTQDLERVRIVFGPIGDVGWAAQTAARWLCLRFHMLPSCLLAWPGKAGQMIHPSRGQPTGDGWPLTCDTAGGRGIDGS